MKKQTKENYGKLIDEKIEEFEHRIIICPGCIGTLKIEKMKLIGKEE